MFGRIPIRRLRTHKFQSGCIRTSLFEYPPPYFSDQGNSLSQGKMGSVPTRMGQRGHVRTHFFQLNIPNTPLNFPGYFLKERSPQRPTRFVASSTKLPTLPTVLATLTHTPPSYCHLITIFSSILFANNRNDCNNK
jgi:hypothetical protein